MVYLLICFFTYLVFSLCKCFLIKNHVQHVFMNVKLLFVCVSVCIVNVGFIYTFMGYLFSSSINHFLFADSSSKTNSTVFSFVPLLQTNMLFVMLVQNHMYER